MGSEENMRYMLDGAPMTKTIQIDTLGKTIEWLQNIRRHLGKRWFDNLMPNDFAGIYQLIVMKEQMEVE